MQYADSSLHQPNRWCLLFMMSLGLTLDEQQFTSPDVFQHLTFVISPSEVSPTPTSCLLPPASYLLPLNADHVFPARFSVRVESVLKVRVTCKSIPLCLHKQRVSALEVHNALQRYVHNKPLLPWRRWRHNGNKQKKTKENGNKWHKNNKVCLPLMCNA